MTISIVIPAYNEAESIVPLVREIAEATAAIPVTEIIVVNDRSDDDTAQVLADLKGSVPVLRVINHKIRSGQSTAIRTGVQQAKGPLIVTMDGDGQNDPADIAALYVVYQQHETTTPRTLVAGQRLKRRDNILRVLSSRIANIVRAAVLHDGVRDTGCGLKLFRRDDFLELPFFDHLHRFIPALMRAKGVNIVLVDVAHRPRLLGQSKYGVWNRVWVGISDMFGVRWIIKRMKAPTGAYES